MARFKDAKSLPGKVTRTERVDFANRRTSKYSKTRVSVTRSFDKDGNFADSEPEEKSYHAPTPPNNLIWPRGTGNTDR